MLIICIVVALLVSALVCLVVMGHHIERQRQSKAELERILKPSNFTAREINEGFAKVRTTSSSGG